VKTACRIQVRRCYETGSRSPSPSYAAADTADAAGWDAADSRYDAPRLARYHGTSSSLGESPRRDLIGRFLDLDLLESQVVHVARRLVVMAVDRQTRGLNGVGELHQ